MVSELSNAAKANHIVDSKRLNQATAAEVAAYGGEHGFDRVSGTSFAAQSVAGLARPIIGSTADLRRISRLTPSVIRCFWPALWTWTVLETSPLWGFCDFLVTDGVGMIRCEGRQGFSMSMIA